MNRIHRSLILAGLLTVGALPSAAADWLETRIAIEELLEAGDTAAAVALGDSLLEEVRTEFGEPSTEVADAMLFLANAHFAHGEPIAAEDRTLAAIDMYEQIDGPISTSLIDPFTRLGDIYRADGQFALALVAFEEARILGRRAHGLLNPDQLELLQRMTATALAAGDFDQAREFQLDAVWIVQRNHGEDSLEFLDAKLDYADWLSALGRIQEAHRNYYEMHDVIEDHFDEDPVLTVRLLQRTAAGLREGGVVAGEYRTRPYELERALNIIERMEQPDPVLHAAVLRDLGDWHVAFGQNPLIEQTYRQAWQMLGGSAENRALRAEWFARPYFIRQMPFQSRVLSAAADAAEGSVSVEFTVDEGGRADNIRIVEAEPAGLVDGAAIRHIASSSFRPIMRDGELTRGVGRRSWSYLYDPGLAGD